MQQNIYNIYVYTVPLARYNTNKRSSENYSKLKVHGFCLIALQLQQQFMWIVPKPMLKKS